MSAKSAPYARFEDWDDELAALYDDLAPDCGFDGSGEDEPSSQWWNRITMPARSDTDKIARSRVLVSVLDKLGHRLPGDMEECRLADWGWWYDPRYARAAAAEADALIAEASQ